MTGQTKSTMTNTVAANEASSAVASQASPDRHDIDPVPAILNANQDVPPEARPTSAPTGLFKMGRALQGQELGQSSIAEKQYSKALSEEAQSELHIKILSYYSARD